MEKPPQRIPLATLIALALSLSLLFGFSVYTPVPPGPILVNPQADMGSGLPVHIKIPKINVDTAVERVGITPGGEMDVPSGPAEVAWYELGTRPGEEGSAVMSGHYGWKDGIPAVFDNLHTLQKGDKIYIVDDTGATFTFVVRELRTYGENQDATDVFGSRDGKAHLNLVTCEGVWNKAEKSYSKRLVVFTDRVEE